VQDRARETLFAGLANITSKSFYLSIFMIRTEWRITGATMPALFRIILTIGLLMLGHAAWAAELKAPPEFEQKDAISPVGNQVKGTIAVERFKTSILRGDDLGGRSGGWLCGSRQPLAATEEFLKSFGGTVSSYVTQEFKRLGFPMTGKGASNAFDVDVAAAPDFRIGGIITETKFEICTAGDRAEGWAYIKVDWAIFSERLQKVVYQATAAGLATSKEKVPDLTKRAVLSSMANFLSSPAVLQALNPAELTKAASEAAGLSSSGAAGNMGPFEIKGVAALVGGAMKNQVQLRNAVVTIETAAGSGSGFFIDKRGYVLTNAHVVQGSKFARLKMQNGDKIVAEVLKVNEQADVALLRASVAVDDCLAIRASSLEVGSEVYAIGSPLGVLNHSVTRGVLSADRVIQGKRVLQSDAAVTFGSSGGPLLDGDGKVVGITQGGVRSGAGFNLFIPIDDALGALQITVVP
jgi:S1-C subfamily serine protease